MRPPGYAGDAAGMTKWEIRKQRGRYVARGPAGATPASVRTHWAMWHAEIRVGDATWPVRVTDRGHRGIVVGAGDGPVVRLHNDWSHIPGGSAPVRWSGGHRGGVLRLGDARVSVSQRGRLVEVVGDWPCLELLVMAAAFAVMTRHRQRQLAILAIVAATSHGPV